MKLSEIKRKDRAIVSEAVKIIASLWMSISLYILLYPVFHIMDHPVPDAMNTKLALGWLPTLVLVIITIAGSIAAFVTMAMAILLLLSETLRNIVINHLRGEKI